MRMFPKCRLITADATACANGRKKNAPPTKTASAIALDVTTIPAVSELLPRIAQRNPSMNATAGFNP